MSVVANVAINVDSTGAVGKLRQVQSQAQQTERAFRGITSAAGALSAALAGAGIAGIALQTTRAAASFNDLQTRLKLLTSEYGEFAKAQQFAAQSAKTFGLSNREAASGVADIYARLRPLGVSLKDIQTTFTGFNTIAKLSGVSAEGASAAFTQLAQALGSGRLQGDEFRSIAEQVPGLLVAVSKETGIAAADLKKFASDGNLTADIIIKSLRRVESEGAGKIAALVQDSDVQRFKDFQNAIDDLSIAIGNKLLPALIPLIKDVTSVVKAIAEMPQPMKSATAEMVKLVAQILLLQKAIQVIIGLRTAFVGSMVAMAATTTAAGTAATASSSAFALYTANTRTLQAAAATATPVLNGMLLTLRNLAAIGAIAIVVNVAVTGMAAVYQAQAEIDRLRGVRSRGGAAAAFGGSATAEQKKAQQATLAAIKKERQSAGFRGQQAAAAAGIGTTFARQRADQLAERERSARAVLTLPLRGGATRPAVAANAMGTPIGATVGGGGGRSGGGGGGGNAAAEAAKRASEQMKEQLKAADDLNFKLKDQLAIAQTTEPVARQMLEYDIKQNEIAKEYGELQKAARSADETALINANRTIELRIAQIEHEQKLNDLLAERAMLMADVMRQVGMPTVYNELETQDAALQAILDKYPAIGAAADAAATLATSGMASMIDGTKSAEQVFADFLNSIANALMQTAAQMIAQYIALGIARMFAGLGGGGGSFAASGPLAAVGNVGTGFNFDVGAMLPGRANGGSVNAGAPYMVGERGPELFVPGRSGTIVSNENLTGGGGGVNVIVNVDAKGSSVQGDDQNAMQLGRVISAAVKSEIITQQRPGGLLAGKR